LRLRRRPRPQSGFRYVMFHSWQCRIDFFPTSVTSFSVFPVFLLLPSPLFLSVFFMKSWPIFDSLLFLSSSFFSVNQHQFHFLCPWRTRQPKEWKLRLFQLNGTSFSKYVISEDVPKKRRKSVSWQRKYVSWISDSHLPQLQISAISTITPFVSYVHISNLRRD